MWERHLVCQVQRLRLAAHRRHAFGLRVLRGGFRAGTGFCFGAAYVSDALTVALWIAVLVALMCFDVWGWMEFGMFTHPGNFLTTGITLLVVLMPVLYRLSRSLWIAMFTKSDA